MKTILVILDGLNYETAESRMGFMQQLCEMKVARFSKVTAALPSMSRPLYETLLTGLNPLGHGIVNNMISRNSTEEHIFALARKAGLKTGAAAYHWVSELYNTTPFNPVSDRITHRLEANIQHGFFYFEDSYPDSHLFLDGEHIRRAYDPDFLLVHTMNIDDAGHHHTSDSKHYREAAMKADVLLSNFLPTWISEGYQIVVTADHGMNADGFHGGGTTDERHVPMWLIGAAFESYQEEAYSQLVVAPMLCGALGIEPGKKMLKMI